jgi:ABC-type lipoprotein export system ATPase subunit
MRYTFFSKDGAEYVRIQVGADAVERPVAEGDKEAADRENAAEDALQATLDKELKERQEREAANEARALGKEPAPYLADEPTQKQLELESDALLAAELEKHGDDNGKHSKKHK